MVTLHSRPVPSWWTLVGLGLVALLLLGGFRWRSRVRSAPRTGERSIVVVVAIDGVRWQELDRGCEFVRLPASRPGCSASELTPNLHRLRNAEGAALGFAGVAPFFVAGPTYLSLPGYQQLFSGRSTVSCASNECGRIGVPTLVDAIAHAYGHEQSAVFSSWERIANATTPVPGTGMVSSGTGGDTRLRTGITAVRALGDPGYRLDEHTAEAAYRYLEQHRPRFLFVGLGDTDEFAHLNDYASYLDALHRADAWVGRFHELGKRWESEGIAMTLFVTTDHGRSGNFIDHAHQREAEHTWLIAAGASIARTRSGPNERARPARAESRPRQLADLAPTIARLLNVSLPFADGSVIEELLLPTSSEQ